MTGTGTTSIGLLLFDEVEVLDACGPSEVFAVAPARQMDHPWVREPEGAVS